MLVLGGDLQSGDTRSCGCLLQRRTAELKFTHGMTDHPLYDTWCSMVHRCTNPKMRNYCHYGGRGIRVHEPWLSDPTQFIGWIEKNLGPRPAGMSLDRINNDGNYVPGNLRWADAKTQANNQRKGKCKMTDYAQLMAIVDELHYTDDPQAHRRLERLAQIAREMHREWQGNKETHSNMAGVTVREECDG